MSGLGIFFILVLVWAFWRSYLLGLILLLLIIFTGGF